MMDLEQVIDFYKANRDIIYFSFLVVAPLVYGAGVAFLSRDKNTEREEDYDAGWCLDKEVVDDKNLYLEKENDFMKNAALSALERIGTGQ